MKLILLFLSLNLYAQWNIEIIPNNPSEAKMQLTGATAQEVKDELVKWIDRTKVYKGVWSESQDGSIIERVIQDLEGNEITQYFKPSDFSVKIEDHTEEENAKKAKETEKQALKDKLKNSDLSLLEMNKLLREFYAL